MSNQSEAEKQDHEWVCGECIKCGASIEKQEPVAWMDATGFIYKIKPEPVWPEVQPIKPLYTHLQPKAEKQEPVAWRGLHPEGDYFYYDEFPKEVSEQARKSMQLIPLYTHPQPKREPLTDEQKLDLVTNWFSDEWAIEYALNLLYDYEIKAAHGIKEEA